MTPLRTAVLLSGGGRTLLNLLDRSDPARGGDRLPIEVVLALSSSARALGLERARARGVPAEAVRRRASEDTAGYTERVFARCREAGAELVCLAGWLKLLRPIPADFQGKVLNIHPALIPAFCGHGYYGERVHRAVWEQGVKLTGCTVHLVDDEYDHGPIVLQRPVPLTGEESPEEIAAKVFAQELEAYPEAIRLLASGRLVVDGRRVRLREDRPGVAGAEPPR